MQVSIAIVCQLNPTFSYCFLSSSLYWINWNSVQLSCLEWRPEVRISAMLRMAVHNFSIDEICCESNHWNKLQHSIDWRCLFFEFNSHKCYSKCLSTVWKFWLLFALLFIILLSSATKRKRIFVVLIKKRIVSGICDSHDSRLIETVFIHKNVSNVCRCDAFIWYRRRFFLCMRKIGKLDVNTNEVKRLRLNFSHVWERGAARPAIQQAPYRQYRVHDFAPFASISFGCSEINSSSLIFYARHTKFIIINMISLGTRNSLLSLNGE